MRQFLDDDKTVEVQSHSEQSVNNVELLNELTSLTEKCTKMQLELDTLKNKEKIENTTSNVLKSECLALKTQVCCNNRTRNCYISVNYLK